MSLNIEFLHCHGNARVFEKWNKTEQVYELQLCIQRIPKIRLPALLRYEAQVLT